MASSATFFEATIPAGTPVDALVTVELPLPTVTIDRVRWRVPPGPRGNLGWILAMGGVQVVPDDTGTFLVADNDSDTWELAGLPNTGAWQLIGYNTGTFDHTVYLTFFTTPVVVSTVSAGDILAGFPTSESDIPTMWL